MKTKIKRHYRSVLSVVLAVCMLVSCMTVGIIATDAAKTAEERVGAADNSEAVGNADGPKFYDYDGATQHYIYYDDSIANISNSGSRTLYFIIGHSDYSRARKMERISGTLLYYIKNTDKWGDSTGFAVGADDSKTNNTYEGSESLDTRITSFTDRTVAYTGTDFDFYTGKDM